MEKLETYMLTVIEDRRQGRPAAVLRWVLKQLSRLYAAIVQLRLALYTHGIFRYHTLGCQVVSVGNLTVGGTGKTPIVEVFARSLQKQGRKVAILSRGYKRHEPPLYKRLFDQAIGKRKLLPTLVVSDGKHLLLDSDVSGDEPYMLASNLPNVAVLVNKNRVKAGQYAITKLGCDTLILDDGFQYLHMKHRLDIVLVDRTNPFGNKHSCRAASSRADPQHQARVVHLHHQVAGRRRRGFEEAAPRAQSARRNFRVPPQREVHPGRVHGRAEEPGLPEGPGGGRHLRDRGPERLRG